MKKLLRKEFALCLHPTSVIFLLFAAIVFAPSYPYEIIFFFSCLSVFFVCMGARENGDAVFSCTLPVKKSAVPLSRILYAVIFQCALLILTAACVCIKQLTFPEEMLVNFVGNSANAALCGFGALLLGVFNLVFFPTHYSNINRVGVPFVIASAVQFVVIGVLIVLRHAPFFASVATFDPHNLAVKLIVLFVGLALYVMMTVLAAFISVRKFVKADL